MKLNMYPQLAMSLDIFLHAILIVLVAIGVNTIVGGLFGEVFIFLSVFVSIALAKYSGENEDVGLLVFRRWLRVN
ncbi:hypothetical protein [Paraglaciecola sp. MB-3u-78]|jgi:hypothetical protein|uniref:hypothetical protein n=1 Tax=Paraglaciecola sp. MB-3u-78 TaxID=2058332 RepID=UPI000C347864|nr:hypothetical protein [Paraglaciecola sp. MB-3u-78]PKG96969.1 hypothetical protein CXF95_21925 [Paraglaciecola sp. MB-3u-78]